MEIVSWGGREREWKSRDERVERLVRHDGEELLDELEVGLVVAEVDLCRAVSVMTSRTKAQTVAHLSVDERSNLLLRRLGDLRVAVSEVGHADCDRAVSDMLTQRRAFWTHCRR